MKKIYTLFLFTVFLTNASAQILTRNESWPNGSWSVGGTYTPAALVFNPSVDSNFKVDAALVGPLGSPITVFATSPIINLKPAFDVAETAINISFAISYAVSATSVLTVQYWDADSSTWIIMPDGNAPIGGQGTISTCTNVPVNLFFDFSGFTTNQLQNFQYRFSVNDAIGNQFTGVCSSSPVITSLSCPVPTNLVFFGGGTSNVTIDWTSSGTNFIIDYGLPGNPGSRTTIQATSHPIGISGLNPGTVYNFFVREDCSNGNQIVLSGWAGPQFFKTATLGLDEQSLKGFKLYPNPTKGIISMESEKALNDVKIFNLTGQELVNVKPNKSNTSIDLSSLSAGFYFLKVSTDEDSGTYKILKE